MYDSDPQTKDIHNGADGLSFPGTAASDTELLRIPINRAIKNEVTARLTLKTGGTADGPNILIGKSLAGTGTVANIGTHNVGTSADDLTSPITLAQTDFAVGDVLVISNAAGTAASTPVVYSIAIDYRPDFD
jgi:hypothetical protein